MDTSTYNQKELKFLGQIMWKEFGELNLHMTY